MSTSVEATPAVRRGFVPTTALADAVEFTEELMQVALTDGRIVGVPLVWFPRLYEATAEQRRHYEIDGGGVSIHWPDLDEDLSVANLLAGADWQST
jgi:hypothetical protein